MRLSLARERCRRRQGPSARRRTLRGTRQAHSECRRATGGLRVPAVETGRTGDESGKAAPRQLQAHEWIPLGDGIHAACLNPASATNPLDHRLQDRGLRHREQGGACKQQPRRARPRACPRPKASRMPPTDHGFLRSLTNVVHDVQYRSCLSRVASVVKCTPSTGVASVRGPCACFRHAPSIIRVRAGVRPSERFVFRGGGPRAGGLPDRRRRRTGAAAGRGEQPVRLRAAGLLSLRMRQVAQIETVPSGRPLRRCVTP